MKKILIALMILVGSILIMPISAEEVTSIDVVQLADGSIQISSEDPRIIEGYSSLVLSNNTKEIKLVPDSNGIVNGHLIFGNPNVVGIFDYTYSYTEMGSEKSLSGKIELTVEVVVADGYVMSLDMAITPPKPDIYTFQDNLNIFVTVECMFDQAVEFELSYATSKNGSYKKLKQSNYGVVTESGKIIGSWVRGTGGKLTPGKAYYVKARVNYKDGGKTVYSAWNTVKYTANVGRAKKVVVDVVSNDSIKVSWTKATGAQEYLIEVWQYPEGFSWDVFDKLAADIEAFFNDYYEAHGGDMSGFDWATYIAMEEELEAMWESITMDCFIYGGKTTSATIKPKKVDFDKSFTIMLYASRKNGELEGQAAHVTVTPKVYAPVNNVVVGANPEGTAITFSFQSPINIDDYPMWRRGDDWWEVAGLSRLGKHNNEPVQQKSQNSLTKNQNGLVGAAGYVGTLDFNLFVSTKATGPFKRVATTADFSDSSNLKLSYKPKVGQKCFYQILPTWDTTDYSEFKINGKLNNDDLNYSLNSNKTTFTVEYTLIPGKPLNIAGVSTDYNKVRISVDKGTSISGYELYDATTGKRLVSQKSNVFNIAATFNTDRTYKIRCFRMNGKKKVYSDFSDEVTVKATLKAPILKATTVQNKPGSIKLSWNKINGAQNYLLYVDGVLVETIKSSTLTKTLNNLTVGQEYKFQIVVVRNGVEVASNEVRITP